MAEIEVNSFRSQHVELETVVDVATIENNVEEFGSRAHHADDNKMDTKKLVSPENNGGCEVLNKGVMERGCSHYRRRCRIRAPCCNEIFDCRHCHNETMNNINLDPARRHDVPRHQIAHVICSLCGTEQEVQKICINCGVCMARYYCADCKLFDDDTSKMQYHCSGCGICRIGGRENFFHCDKCGCCYSVLLENGHPCVEGAMHHDCPVCFEYLFESRNDVSILPCGHTIHRNCLKEMQEHSQYACPLCSKSVCDMSKVWERFDMEIAATPMPETFQKRIWILCNDCGANSEVVMRDSCSCYSGSLLSLCKKYDVHHVIITSCVSLCFSTGIECVFSRRLIIEKFSWISKWHLNSGSSFQFEKFIL